MPGDVFCDNQQKYVNYFNIGSMTFNELVGYAKSMCESAFTDPKEKGKCDMRARTIITKAGDNASKPLNFADIKTKVFPNGIKGTPPYKKPNLPTMNRIQGDTDPSDMTGDPNWPDGYFSVAYLNALYKAYVDQSKKPSDEYINKYFDTDMINKFTKEQYDRFVSRLNSDELCEGGDNLRYRVPNDGERSCSKYYHFKKCNKIAEEILAKPAGPYNPVEKDHLPKYNNPNPKKQGFLGRGGGKRKHRRTKTNKIRTRTNTKKIKNTKKKNKRVKHSKKAKKARKSRNARKTRKH